MRDTSFRVPPGVEGTVVDVKIFSRSGVRKDKRYKDEVTKQIANIEDDFNDHFAFLEAMVTEKISKDLDEKKAAAGLQKHVQQRVFID